MDSRSAIRDFLTSRRARVTPDQVGLISYGMRRVPGLRRGELAQLAGVSVEYYTRLERGNVRGVSDSVLNAIAVALGLDDLERQHLFDLTRAAETPTARPGRRRAAPDGKPQVRPAVQRMLDSMTGMPAFIRNHRFDVLAANDLARALYCDLHAEPAWAANTARYMFLDPRARTFYRDWEAQARRSVGAIRVQTARHPDDGKLTGLIGELVTRSDEFRAYWAAQDVFVHDFGVKRFRHRVVGDLELTYEGMTLASDTGLTIMTYSAEPGTPSGDSLQLLGSWSLSTSDLNVGQS